MNGVSERPTGFEVKVGSTPAVVSSQAYTYDAATSRLGGVFIAISHLGAQNPKQTSPDTASATRRTTSRGKYIGEITSGDLALSINIGGCMSISVNDSGKEWDFALDDSVSRKGLSINREDFKLLVDTSVAFLRPRKDLVNRMRRGENPTGPDTGSDPELHLFRPLPRP